MTSPLDLNRLTEAEKDAQILALWAQVQELRRQNTELTARVAELERKLGEPAKSLFDYEGAGSSRI